MGSYKDIYDINVTVWYDKKVYTVSRHYESGSNNGCNHIENIPGTAEYMGQEILEKIKSAT